MNSLSKKAYIKQKLTEAKKLIPPLGSNRHKGQSGRLGVIGGSLEYSGAPYFSAIAGLKVGCDLAHVICEISAANVIKSYSPDLIVHPTFQTSVEENKRKAEINKMVEQVKSLLPRLHCVVVGPGLSRNELMLDTIKEVIKEIKKEEIPLVIDADGLFLIQNHPELIKGYTNAVLTPNIVEFKRLCQTLEIPSDTKKEELCSKLSLALGGVTIVQKGEVDIISNGENTYSCNVDGGLKRCGGQGDLLSGIIGAFMAWESMYHKKEWDHPHDLNRNITKLLGCYAACAIVRSSSSEAFATHFRSLQTSDIVPLIPSTTLKLLFSSESNL